MDPSNHVIIEYQNGSGATYEPTILTSPPKAFGPHVGRDLVITSLKDSRVKVTSNEFFDIDDQLVSSNGSVYFL